MRLEDLFPLKDSSLFAEKKSFNSETVELGEAGGMLPGISTLTCQNVDKSISDAEEIAKVWRPNAELLAEYNTWMEKAKQKQADCKNAVITPVPKKKISKNLTPIVIIAGAVVAGIIFSKIFSNDK